jgi:tetratricopeptide (TPR) repeat protein
MLRAADVANPAQGAIDPELRARINRLLKRAGDAFASHANTPETKGSQDGSFAASLWAAADSYDLAGWREAAIANFTAYLEATQPEDLARADAYWRIAVLNHAEGAYNEAAKFYLKTIEVSENQRPKAIVPLARALAAAGRVADAAQQLQSVIDGVAGLKPSAEEYFEALDLFARLSFEKGDAVRSAELLREAIARRPEDARVGELSFRLGESLRMVSRSAREVAESGDVSVARREQLVREADERMREARRAFEQTIAALEPRGDALDGLARDMVREAHLARAHCAYDLAQFEDAIPLYEAVDRKYPEHASSMVALIQIVNCCDALGDATRAETAHRRAQLRLARLPDDAFLAGGGILARESWEQWLRNHPPGGRRVAATESDSTGEAP